VVKAKELAELDDDELEQRLADCRQELFNLRFQLATGQLDNVARIGQVRKDVARIKTLLRQREIEAAEAYYSGRLPASGKPEPGTGDEAAPTGSEEPEPAEGGQQ
jgi:large subunit ribosomal protein L29